MIIVICFMAVTSSGASEMLAVSSLFTFDIYRRYINPKVRAAAPLRGLRMLHARVQPCMRSVQPAALFWTRLLARHPLISVRGKDTA